MTFTSERLRRNVGILQKGEKNEKQIDRFWWYWGKTAYLNISLDEAVKRYFDSLGSLKDFESIETIKSRAEIIDFDDSFGVYDAYSLG